LVLAELSKLSYRLTPTPSGDDFLVEVPNPDKTWRVIGGVAFKNRKLIWISRDYTPVNKDEVSVAGAIYEALAQVSPQGRNLCEISMNAQVADSGDIRDITLQCVARKSYITILICRLEKGRSVSIQEILRAPDVP